MPRTVISANELKLFNKNDPKFDILYFLRLNQDQKELFLSSMFARELRHSVQNHVLASTKGVGIKYIDKLYMN